MAESVGMRFSNGMILPPATSRPSPGPALRIIATWRSESLMTSPSAAASDADWPSSTRKSEFASIRRLFSLLMMRSMFWVMPVGMAPYLRERVQSWSKYEMA